MKKLMIMMLTLTGACICQANLVTNSVVADSIIHTDFPDTNYGSETYLLARKIDADSWVKTYVKFDASGLGAGVTVTDVDSFTMTYIYTYSRQAQFYLITGGGVDAWDESTITWNNAPGNDASGDFFLNDGTYTSVLLGVNSLATANPEVIGFEWDSPAAMDALINELNTGDRVATIGITRNGTSRWAQFAADENTQPPMTLVLDTIPEPATMGLIGVASAGLVLFRRYMIL